MDVLRILFPILMVIGALGSLVVNVIQKGDWPPVSVVWCYDTVYGINIP